MNARAPILSPSPRRRLCLQPASDPGRQPLRGAGRADLRQPLRAGRQGFGVRFFAVPRWPSVAAARKALLLACLALAGCAMMSPVAPVPHQLPPLPEARQFRVDACGDAAQAGESSLVVVQPQADGSWRWQQLDAFGAPRARMIVRAGGAWQNDGFMPPDAGARALFAGMLLLLTPESLRTQVWPALHTVHDGDWTMHLDGKALRWRTRADGEGWRLQLQDDAIWCVQPLS